MGGIGNQIFQYAAARRLAHINNTQLLLDLSWFEESGPSANRKYELAVFNISGAIAASSDVAALKSKKPNPFWNCLSDFLNKFNFHINQTQIITEKDYSFNSAILSIKGNIYLNGYWQSEKYFIDIEEIIRREISFKTNPLEYNQSALDKIKSSESIAVHIRRGDYVTDEVTNAYHGLCNLEYYRLAANHIANQLKKPVFFVFSDDITWARDNLNLDYEINFMDYNHPEQGWEDLRLMSSCKHQIIANSSFSWWGAWLNHNPGKIVIAPQKWFNDISINIEDLLPAGWVRL
jgi:hypothetical protein